MWCLLMHIAPSYRKETFYHIQYNIGGLILGLFVQESQKWVNFLCAFVLSVSNELDAR